MKKIKVTERKDTFMMRKKLFRPMFSKEGREHLSNRDNDLTVDGEVENESLWMMKEATLIIKYASNKPLGEEDMILDEKTENQ